MPHISASLQSLTYSQEKNIKNRHEWHLQWFFVIRYTRVALHALCCDCVLLQTVFYVFLSSCMKPHLGWWCDCRLLSGSLFTRKSMLSQQRDEVSCRRKGFSLFFLKDTRLGFSGLSVFLDVLGIRSWRDP